MKRRTNIFVIFERFSNLLLSVFLGIGYQKYNQDAGKLRIPQSPSNRAQRAVPVHISTPIAPQRLSMARSAATPSSFDDSSFDKEIPMPSASPRQPAYQLTRIASSPNLSRSRYDPQSDQQFMDFDTMRSSSGGGFSTDNTAEYFMAADGTPIYLETQIPPPYVDDLPERKQMSRRKRSEALLSYNEDGGGSEYGDSSVMEDPLDAAMVTYPRSVMKDSRARKKMREMTDDDRLEYGRESKVLGKNNVKRRRKEVYADDDNRSEISQYDQQLGPTTKRPRLHESSSQLDPAEDEEQQSYDSTMMVDSDEMSFDDYDDSFGNSWASGPSQLRRRRSSSSSVSHYSGQGDRHTMSKANKTNNKSSHKSSSSARKRKTRPSKHVHSSDLGDVDSNSMGMDVTGGEVGTVEGFSTLANASMSTTPRSSYPPTVPGSAMISPNNSAAPSTNHSPTKPTSVVEPIPTSHSGVFGIPIHSMNATTTMGDAAATNTISTPSTPAAASATRQARLQMLRDQSHTLTSTPLGTPSFSRAPLTNSATKRSLEPPIVAFTPTSPTSVAETSSSYQQEEGTPSTPSSSSSSSSSYSSTTNTTSTTTTNPTVVAVSDVSEPEEDARISHLLQSAHQRKEDKDIKQKQKEEKEKEKQALQSTFKLGTQAATATQEESAEGEKPTVASALSAPKFGFKPPGAASGTPVTATTTSSTEESPKPAFKVPTGLAKTPSFGTPSAAPGAAKGLFSPIGGAGAGTGATTSSLVASPTTSDKTAAAGGGYKFGGVGGATKTPTSGLAITTQTPSIGGAPSGLGGFKPPTSMAAPMATSSLPAPSAAKQSSFATPGMTAAAAPSGLFRSPAAAAPLATQTTGNALAGQFSAKPTTTPSFGAQKPSGLAGGVASGFGASSNMASPASATSSTNSQPGPVFGATKPTSFGATKPAFGASGASSSSSAMMTSPDKSIGQPSGFGAGNGGFGAGNGGMVSTPSNGGGGGGGFSASGAAKPSGFGNNSSAASKPSGFGNSMGAGTSTPTGGAGTPGAGGFAFNRGGGGGGGQTQQAGGFGGQTSSSSGFGGQSNSPAPASSGFGAKPAASTFGAVGSTTPGGGFNKPSGFGSQQQQQQQQPQQQQLQQSPASRFGGQTSSGFGNSQASSGFGNTQQQQSSAAQTGLFSGGGGGGGGVLAPRSSGFGPSSSGTSSPSTGGFPSTPRRTTHRPPRK
jgi:hypothetical protein